MIKQDISEKVLTIGCSFHPPYGGVAYVLNNSKAYLENLLHHKIEAFSYPNGNFSNREIEAVKKAGYKMAFTTEYTPVQINHTNLYRIPRMAMNTYGGYYENLSKILGIWQSILK